jgi:hypothetical protein
MTWQNGNLNENQAHFIEGHSVPYRAVMHDLPAGKLVTITFGFDLVNSNKYALDFITGYQWLQPHNYVNHTVAETVDPTLTSGTSLSGAPTSWKVITPASYLTDYSGQPAATAAGAAAAYADFQNIESYSNAAGKIGLWGGNFTAAPITYEYKQNNSTIDKVQLLNLANGETKVEWTVSFIATGGDAIIAFGGHIARKQDWGQGLTAGGLTGSPYHTREKGWVVDGNAATLGAADRSLKVALSEPTCPPALCTSQVCDNVCPGSTQTFKVPAASTATGYEWSIINNTAGASFVGGTPATTDSTATITTTQAGAYTVQVILSNGSGFISTCTKTVNVTVTPPPTAVNNSRCGAGEVQISVTGCNGTVNWYAASSGGSAIATGATYTPNLTSTTTFYATCTDARGCESARVPVEAKINPIPTATATSDAKCPTTPGGTTASFDLTSYEGTVKGSQTGVTVTWFSNSGLSAAITGSDLTSYSVNGTATVYAKVTDDVTGCNSSAAVTLTVNSTPVGSADPATICSGATTNIALHTTVSGTSFTWTAAQFSGAAITGFSNCASGCGTSIQQALTNTGTSPGVVRYTVTPSANNCSGAAFTVDVTVNPTPTVNSISNRTHCNGEHVNGIAFSGAVAGTTFTWSSTADVGFGTSGTTDIPDYTAANSGTSPVTATITVTPSANNCTGAAITFTVTVNPTPVGSGSPASICSGATTNIGLSSNVSGTTYTWTAAIQTTPAGGTITGFSNGSGTPIAQTLTNTGTTAGVVRYTVTPSANNCAGAPFTVDVTVKPTPTVNQPGSQTVCNNTLTTAINFSGAVSGTDFNWTNDNTSIGLAGSGTGNIAAFNATNNGTSPVTATITVTPTASGCSGSSKTFTITVNPTPTVDQPGSQVVCDNTSTTAINFTGAVSGTDFSWTNNNTSIGLAASGTGSSIAAFTAHNSGTTPVTANITVTPSANGCTGASKNFTITVNPTPTVNPIDNITICMGESMPGINLSGAVSGATFTWHSTLNVGFGTDGTSNIGTFTATGSNVVATVTVTPSANGCTGTPITFTVTVNNCGVTNGTYTQGYYGSTGKSCDGTGPQSSATALITKLLSSGQLTVGRSGRSVVIPSTAATILNSVMPGGGTANKLTVASDVPISNLAGSTFQKNYLTKQGRINNVFLSQTITLSLNVRMGQLGEFPIELHDDPSTPAIEDSRFQTESTTTTDCKDFTAVDCSAKDFYITGSVANYLTRGGSQAATVMDLLALANDLLGNVRKPGELYNGYTVPSYSDVSSAVDVINNAFDGWRYWPGSYNTHLECPLETTDAVTASSARTAGAVLTEQAADKLTVLAYPNPFNDVIKFTIESNVSGQAQLEIVNMLGQKVATVYNGHIQANKSQVVEYKVPPAAQQNLIFMLKIGGQHITGKLLKGK